MAFTVAQCGAADGVDTFQNRKGGYGVGFLMDSNNVRRYSVMDVRNQNTIRLRNWIDSKATGFAPRGAKMRALPWLTSRDANGRGERKEREAEAKPRPQRVPYPL